MRRISTPDDISMSLSDAQRIGLSLLPSGQQRQLREQFIETKTLQGSLLEDICHAFSVRIERDLKSCQDNAIALVSCMDDGYPELLHHIPDFPLMVYVKGDVECLRESACLGIVGTRHATPYGLQMAKSLADDLARHGVMIVSGLAQGIDGAAHSGAMLSGKTIAVIGTGIDLCYPTSHKSLMNAITKKGCVVSEFPLKTHGSKLTFPLRNRIIAGLSKGVLVVESQAHGGSLITARLALEYNREVFALPGRADESTSQGTLQLIREGAVLIRHADDILSELQWTRSSSTQTVNADKNNSHLSEPEINLLRHLSCQAMSLDELAGRVQGSSGSLLSTLSQLEMKGYLTAEPGGYYRKTPA